MKNSSKNKKVVVQSVKDTSLNLIEDSQWIMTTKPLKSVDYSAATAILDFWVDIPIQIYLEQLRYISKSLDGVGSPPKRSVPKEGSVNEQSTPYPTG